MNLENLDKMLRLMIARSLDEETLPVTEGPEQFWLVLKLASRVCFDWEFEYDPEFVPALTPEMFEVSGAKNNRPGIIALKAMLGWAGMRQSAADGIVSAHVERGLISVAEAMQMIIVDEAF
jgi:hypothetical protein